MWSTIILTFSNNCNILLWLFQTFYEKYLSIYTYTHTDRQTDRQTDVWSAQYIGILKQRHRGRKMDMFGLDFLPKCFHAVVSSTSSMTEIKSRKVDSICFSLSKT